MRINREKAVSRENAQKAQKKESVALTETFTEWVTTVSTPSFSFCAFCAFSRPSTAVFRIKQMLVSLAALCAIATVEGCASTDRQASQSSFDVMNLNRDRKPSPAAFSQQVNLNQLAFQNPELDTNGAVTSDERQRFDTNAAPQEYFSALAVNGDAQINVREFLTQTPNNAKRYHFFADPEKANKQYSSPDQEEFQQPGWQLFSIRF